MPAPAELLVIIVTFNGMRWIERCIASVLSADMPADILVVDNGSSDGTVEWLRTRGIEVLAQGGNPGFGAANNLGFRRALDGQYAYVYLLNQDAWVRPDCFTRLVAAFRRHPEYAVLSPVQYDGGERQMDRNFARHCARALASDPSEVVDIPFVMAAHWMLKAACVSIVGGFSPAFPHYGEDDNYLHRARYFGFRVGVVRDAGAVHAREGRTRSRQDELAFKCIGSPVRISDPRRHPLPALLLEILRLFAMGVVHASSIPWQVIPTLIRRYPSLKAYRAASMDKGAFL